MSSEHRILVREIQRQAIEARRASKRNELRQKQVEYKKLDAASRSARVHLPQIRGLCTMDSAITAIARDEGIENRDHSVHEVGALCVMLRIGVVSSDPFTNKVGDYRTLHFISFCRTLRAQDRWSCAGLGPFSAATELPMHVGGTRLCFCQCDPAATRPSVKAPRFISGQLAGTGPRQFFRYRLARQTQPPLHTAYPSPKISNFLPLLSTRVYSKVFHRMSGAAEGIAGLALSAVSVAALFTTCIECYSLVVAAREFGEDYELLCTELSLQKLRFFLWGESVGLVSRTPDTQPRPNPGLDDPAIQPTVIRTLNAIKNLLSETQEFDARYGFKTEGSTTGSSSRGLSIFKGTFDQFRSHARRNQAQKSIATVTRWAIFDADNFETKITRLKGFIDGLESVTRSLVALDAQRNRLREEIESISDVDSLRLLRDASSRASQDVSEAASLRLSNIELRRSLDSMAATTRSPISASNRTFYFAHSHSEDEAVPRDVRELDAEQSALRQVNRSRQVGSELSFQLAEPERRETGRNNRSIWGRISSVRTTRLETQDTRLRTPQGLSAPPLKNLMALYKIVVLGDGGVGKTALTIQFALQHYVTRYDPTIEDSYRKQAVIDGVACIVEILDTAGQEEYTALRDQWIRDGEAFVLVYSISSRSSFTRIQRFHNQVKRVKESLASSPSYTGSLINSIGGPVSSPIMMLVGHDYHEDEGSERRERVVSEAEGQSLATKWRCDFMEASAEKCLNVNEVFYNVVRKLRKQRADLRAIMPPIQEQRCIIN